MANENLLQELDFTVSNESTQEIDFDVWGLVNDAATQAKFALEALKAYNAALAANEDTEELQTEVQAMAQSIHDDYERTRLNIPTKVSQLTNDSGYLDSETDPTVPSWAKAETKPEYTAAEIQGLAEVATSGSYNDLSNKPEIPPDVTARVTALETGKADKSEIPTELPNPYPIIINGTAYDGTEEKEFTLGGGGGTTYTLTKSGNTISLNGADGSITSVTDSDTIYDDTALAARVTAAENDIDAIADVTIPGLQTAINAKANSSDLATVATSGSYDDLSNKPTIPAADDHKWNDVELSHTISLSTFNTYIPQLSGQNVTSASLVTASTSPTAGSLAKYDSSSYLYSTTPPSTDNTTKVATTAFVGTAISGKANSADLATTNSNVSTNTTNIADHETRIDDLEADVMDLQGTVAAHTSTLATHAGKLLDIEGADLSAATIQAYEDIGWTQ